MTVAKRTDAAQALYEAAQVGRALMGSTKAMRNASKTYLPQFPAESVESYEARRDSSFLFNGFKKTVKDMTGRVFVKPIEVSEGNLDAGIEANVDGQNNDLSAFLKSVFESALAGSGVEFIMVDAPRRDGDVSKAEAQASNLQPYLVHISLESVLGWKSELVGAKRVLTQFRFMETIEETSAKDEFTVDLIEQVRVLTLIEGRVNVRLFRKGDKDDWTVFDDYMTDAPEITVQPFYAARTGYMTGEPPLQDLADKNVEHWQSSSDQRNILHSARVPILFAAGHSDNDGDIVISSGVATASSNPDAKLSWVEHSGASIGAGRDDLKDLEFQMQVLGLQLLVAGTETATGAALDAAKETAPLSMMADSLKDCTEQLLAWVSMYQGSEQEFVVDVNKEFGVNLLTAQEVTAMLSAVNTGNLSKATFIDEMKRRGFVRGDLDTQKEIDAIETEAPDLELAG